MSGMVVLLRRRGSAVFENTNKSEKGSAQALSSEIRLGLTPMHLAETHAVVPPTKTSSDIAMSPVPTDNCIAM
jgi:hypothetical protein